LTLYSFVATPPPPSAKAKKGVQEREFDPSKYSTRLIALKLSYLGKNYNGFEHHIGNITPLPTIEEELWQALIRARLIFPKDASPLKPGEVNWEGCEYSKCGRTDKGVSAFGQVIGIRVRSNRPLPKKKDIRVETEEPGAVKEDWHNTLPRRGSIELASPPLYPSQLELNPAEEMDGLSLLDDPDYEEALAFDPVKEELPYTHLLNRLLPPDIRILAWCPFPPSDFSARFSCKERQYRYFFTQPAFAPLPKHLDLIASKGQNTQDGWLNIEAMREAASYFVGNHDFRNFCKVDASKQITNFEREIFKADIEEVDDTTTVLGFLKNEEFGSGDGASDPRSTQPKNFPKIYTFTLHGSAFLWHQVRCMVSVLFLVGQGLEKPTIVKELLDVEKNPRRPMYEMATDTPLVLWNCVFPHEGNRTREDALNWIYIGDEDAKGEQKYGTMGLIEDLWKVWRNRKIDEILAGTLIDVVAKQGRRMEDLTTRATRRGPKSQKVFLGGDKARLQGVYIPVMKKPLMESVTEINEKYALKKGFESAADLKAQGYLRLNKPSESINTADE
jgi:tRNA pseudouridine38/39 synthase